MQDKSRHGDRRACREMMFDLIEAGIPGGISVAMAIGVDHHRHKITMVKRRGCLVIGGIVKVPGWGPLLPQEPADAVTILLQPHPAPLSVEIPLVPVRALFDGG